MTKPTFIFSLEEATAAELLGISIETIRTWRTNTTLPDYLYRRFGSKVQPRIRYCQLLLLRWQALSTETERLSEEIWARSEVEKSLMVK